MKCNPCVRVAPETTSGREGIRTPDFCLRSPLRDRVCLRFLGFRDSAERAVARECVRSCALVGLLIPPEVVQLAWAVLEDRRATEREVKLARWALSACA